MKLEEFKLLDYVDKKNGRNAGKSIYKTTYAMVDNGIGGARFRSYYYVRSYHKIKTFRSCFEITLSELLDGNLNIEVYHLTESKIGGYGGFYEYKISKPTINKIKNEFREFFSILLLDEDIVEKIVSQSEFVSGQGTAPIIEFKINVGNKKLNSFMINWLNEAFDSNREEIDKYIDSFDIFKNKNLIEDYIEDPKSLAEFIKNEPEWKTLLELKYRS